MAWNPDNNFAPQEFLEIFNDEEDSGSELEYLMSDEEFEDTIVDEDVFNVESMPIITLDEDDHMHPVPIRSPTPSALSRTPVPLSRSPSPGSERSLTPPPYSPLSSPVRREAEDVPRERFVVFYGDAGDAAAETRPDLPARGRRGQARTRGMRTRGGNRGRRAATSALSNATGSGTWRRGEPILEVCLSDEDVPPSLREMVRDLEASRSARRVQEMRRRQNVRVNENDEEDVYYDAVSSMATELFDGDQSALNFQWSPMASFHSEPEAFSPDVQPGPRSNTSCPYGAFRQYWDDEILEHIVRETNRYASELKSTSQKFAREWYDTNVHEILIFFSFWMMLGIVRMPSIRSCYSNNSLLKTSIFRTLLTEPRYWMLNRALHFVNNATRSRDSSKLFCLGPIVEHLNRKFTEAYTPAQDIAIDESLTLWKGNLSFRQYIKTKAARFGIKSFELCESATGYLWSFIIYQGKENGASFSVLPKSTEVVVKLIRPLLNKGYRLFLDNWYNSPLLARFLKRNHTDCVGTLKKTRKDVPLLIKLATIPEGTCIARHSGDVVVMAYQDKKTVYTISTCHGTDCVPIPAKSGRPAHYKPAVVADYNKFMGGVDKKDQMLEPYLIERKKCLKWYMKLFKRLLNVSILNSRTLVDRSTSDTSKQLAFRLALVQKIMQTHLTHVPKPRQRHFSNKNADLSEARFIGVQSGHFIVRGCVPEQPRTSQSRNSLSRRYCIWCLVREKRYSRTVWLCERCDEPLCLEGCFKKYHTVA